jgi:hypothetical protein
MKTLKKFIYLFILPTIILFSCSGESTINNENTESVHLFRKFSATKISSLISVKKSTDSISSLFFTLGVKSIITESKNNKSIYSIETINQFGLLNDLINLADYKFVLEENKLYELNNPEYFLDLQEGEIFINTPTQTVVFENYTELVQNKLTTILFLFFNEISNNEMEKSPFAEQYNQFEMQANRAGCSFMNTYYVVGVGLTTSAAHANLANYDGAINSFTCKKLNKNSDLTDWGGFYTSVDTYCCPSCFPRCGAGGSW